MAKWMDPVLDYRIFMVAKVESCTNNVWTKEAKKDVKVG